MSVSPPKISTPLLCSRSLLCFSADLIFFREIAPIPQLELSSGSSACPAAFIVLFPASSLFLDKMSPSSLLLVLLRECDPFWRQSQRRGSRNLCMAAFKFFFFPGCCGGGVCSGASRVHFWRGDSKTPCLTFAEPEADCPPGILSLFSPIADNRFVSRGCPVVRHRSFSVCSILISSSNRTPPRLLHSGRSPRYHPVLVGLRVIFDSRVFSLATGPWRLSSCRLFSPFFRLKPSVLLQGSPLPTHPLLYTSMPAAFLRPHLLFFTYPGLFRLRFLLFYRLVLRQLLSVVHFDSHFEWHRSERELFAPFLGVLSPFGTRFSTSIDGTR